MAGPEDEFLFRLSWAAGNAGMGPLSHDCPSSGLSPEVGVCSFARFSGEFLQAGPSVPDPALLEAAADGPETLPHEGGRTLCFSALGMVQCCKVSMGTGRIRARSPRQSQG